ncbi:MAG: LamG-like jellyroll fold domain-containing protein [Almyronema sp.]
MSRIAADALKQVQITGPLWSAEVEVLQAIDSQNWAFRTLFLETTPQTRWEQSQLFLPGTLLLLSFVRQVRVQPNGEAGDRYLWQRSPAEIAPTDLSVPGLKASLASGQLALLLVQAEAAAWPAATGDPSGDRFLPPSLQCIAGEISLAELTPQSGAIERLYQALPLERAAAAFQHRQPASEPDQPPQPARLLAEITVHSSGLSVYGQTWLPWQKEDASPVQAPFWLRRDFSRDAAGNVRLGEFRVQPEKERLTPAEAQTWKAVWQQLSRYLNPAHPLSAPQSEVTSDRLPQWVTLEMTAPLAVPDLFWLMPDWGDPASLQFAPDEFSLIISDRPPYNSQKPPTSLARIAPTQVAIAAAASGLQLTFTTTKPAAPPPLAAGSLGYQYQVAADGIQERLTTTALKTAFSPVAVARFLRHTQNLAEPEWIQASDPTQQQPIQPPLVWGFMPLENGWAQIPVANLTEQIYLDSTLENPLPTATPAMLQGAIALGNEAVLTQYPAEQPWNLTWTDGDRLTGTWQLSTTAAGFRLSQIDLDVSNPVITLNGFFWLSPAAPRIEDALPDLDDWVTGLQSFALKTAQPDQDLFPAPMLMSLPDLTLAVRDRNSQQPSAELGPWRLRYEIDDRVLTWATEDVSAATTATVFARMVQQGVLRADTFSVQLPLIWQRHGRLPMVQALPLTQSQTPPNYASASRQLVPFELPVDSLGLPQQWLFAAASAASWLRLSDQSSSAPATDWRSQFDLPLVALSLPGVLLDPLADLTPLGIEADPLGLTPNYRFDLPYTDEINAFAQLPSPVVDPTAVSPLPDSPTPEAPQPLTRETLGAHWQTLSQLASLASADGVTAWGCLQVYQAGPPETWLFSVDEVALAEVLTAGGVSARLRQLLKTQGIALSAAATVQPDGEHWLLTDGESRYRLKLKRGLQHLIEPFEWLVQPRFQLSEYPGTLTLQNGAATSLSAETALAGISGQFAVTADQISHLPAPTPTAYTLTAGSMAAQLQADGLADQRGLVRGWPQINQPWLQTPVSFRATTDLTIPYALTTAQQSLPLTIDRHSTWQLWFRDLPLRLPEATTLTTGVFQRRDRLSPLAQDVNDPEARSRQHDFLAGYEWRLAADPASTAYLPLFSLHFYPLTLETVALANGQLQKVVIIGRLQLPLMSDRELTDFSNAVELTFTPGETDELNLTAIALVAEQGEWPLALKDNEASDAPLLVWQAVTLTAAGDGLKLQNPKLKFILFDHLWTVPLNDLHPTAAPATTAEWIFSAATPAQTQVYAVAAETAYLRPDCLSLTLDPVGRHHQAHLDIRLELGRSAGSAGAATSGDRLAWVGQVRFPLLTVAADPSPQWTQATLLAALRLDPTATPPARTLVTSSKALQFRWQHYQVSTANADWQLLPGMALRSPLADATTAEAPGFAAITFELQPVAEGIPTLVLTSAFLETLLFCQWGQFLQTDAENPAAVRSGQLAQVFGASAGEVVCAYTTTWQAEADAWSETLLLNGVLEVKNLISWPQALRVEAEAEPTLLHLPLLPTASGWRSLPHWRHSLRILLNQHQLPAHLLRAGEGNLLFQLQPQALWQFWAVVEHQLIAVEFSGDGEALQIQLRHDRRWSVTQVVSWIAPAQFQARLESWAAIASPDPSAGIAQEGAGYFDPALRTALLAELTTLAQPLVLIEASGYHWLNQAPLTALSPTTLQFLPNGSQQGILSSPLYYQPSDPADPRWLLLNLPCLGRLQPTEALDVTAAVPAPLQGDPVLHLAQPQPVSPLALMLASWQPPAPGDVTTIQVAIAALDTAAGRTWGRLDAQSLEESWFRLQHPVPETLPRQFQSVMAALPDSPARLSRAPALSQNMDSGRFAVPPAANPLAGDPSQRPTPGLLKTQGLAAPAGLQVLYQFQGGTGNTVADSSGVGEPLDLVLLAAREGDRDNEDNRDNRREETGPAWQWQADGLSLLRPAVLISPTPATKLTLACQATKALTVEAWIQPTYAADYPYKKGPFPIVSLSRPSNCSFSLEQGAEKTRREPPDFFVARVQTSQTNDEGKRYRDDLPGEPFIQTERGRLSQRLCHVVYTRNPQGETRFYLDGELLASRLVPGDFSTWDFDLSLTLGNEGQPYDTSDRLYKGKTPWLGKYYRVAIYNQALSASQVAQHFAQGYSGPLKATAYPWGNTGVQLATSQLTQPSPVALSRYAAATLLPPASADTANPLPQSFAVSPYLGLGFLPAAPVPYQRQLVSAELLCLDRVTRSLRPIASHLWETLSALEQSLVWAKETHLRLSPESPLAVLRFREIRRLSAADSTPEAVATVITTYTYGIVAELQPAELPLKRVFRLRSPVSQLRFREGHFGGSVLPPLATLNSFELLPPPTTGAQPLYFTQSPSNRPWPWGLSALRLSLQNTGQKQGVVGTLGLDDQAERILWWQATPYTVQYRSATAAARPTAGLPAQFRSAAIASLLPVALQPPLPLIDGLEQFQPQAEAGDRWQAILPGTLRYLIVGDRPGVFFNCRHHILRQGALAADRPSTGSVLVSGSVPVQHRLPRPVPLPSNTLPDQALQPWASYFEPNRNALVTPGPADEAFFGSTLGNNNLPTPAQRLRLELISPAGGAIAADWDGQLVYRVDAHRGTLSQPTALSDWQITLKAIANGITIAFIAADPDTPGEQRYQPADSQQRQQLKNLLELLPAGSTLRLQAEIQPAAAADNFSQTLSFRLRLRDPLALPLPLQPQFIQFEDPEYNRQLASPTAYTVAQVQVPNPTDPSQPQLVGLKLACDRREYNPDSVLSLRYDWQIITAAQHFQRLSLTLKRIRAGIETALALPHLAPRLANLPSAELTQWALTDLARSPLTPVADTAPAEAGALLQADDTLQLTLNLYRQAAASEPDQQLVLQVKIVAEPVQPAPEAAYGLLRRHPDGAVECVRFAWGVSPSRVEMINASDLQTEVVRRRAVFQWTATQRVAQATTYAVQKITQTGSTVCSMPFSDPSPA